MSGPAERSLAASAARGLDRLFPRAEPPSRRADDAAALAALVHGLPDLVVHADAGGVLRFVSGACRALTGFAPDALAGLRAADLAHPEERAEVAAALAALAAGACGEATLLHRHARADGGWVWVEAAWRGLADGGLAGVIRDATRRREADAALKASRDHYRALADTLPQLVWMERADTGETIYANRAFEAYLGVIGPSSEARTARHHPDDRARIASAYAAARAQGGSHEAQARLRRHDGVHHWHQLVVRPLRKDGHLLGWLGSALDIDEVIAARRALQETGDLLRLAQEAAGAGLFDLSLVTGEAILSPESARLHGLPGDRPAIIALPDWLRRVHRDDRAPTLRAMRSAIAERHAFDLAYRVRGEGTAAGGWIQAIGRLCQDEAGVPVRVIGLNLDVSARKDTESALIEAKGAAEAARLGAERANAAKTDFLSAMSHEIRTPLNAVIGFTGLLAADARLEPDLRRYADLARVSGESLLGVVNDILDFSSVEAGAISLRQEPFGLASLVEGCLALVEPAARAKGLAAGCAIDAGLPADLLGDAARLRQILLNLLNNAVKFTAHGRVALAVGHEGSGARGERLRFSVTDSGIGIAAADQGRLFERFSQVDGSIRRDYGGTGLGLAICKRLVEAMGGEIGVVSEAGAGATFWFTLALPRTAAAPAPPRPAPAALRASRILLVEDMEINRELACAMLRRAGHAVDVAVDGFSAVRAVEAGRYDLVLMDVQMPGMDGMMATRLIRCLPGEVAATPVIAVTANVLPDEVRAFREAGMDDHLGKPFHPADLAATLARWLPSAPAAEAPPAVDRERCAHSLALLPPDSAARLLGHLARLAAESLAGPAGTPDERAALRAQAHALASVSGLLGFAPLSAACARLDACAETAPDAFDGALARARTLAAAAAAEARHLLAGMGGPDAASGPRAAS